MKDSDFKDSANSGKKSGLFLIEDDSIEYVVDCNPDANIYLYGVVFTSASTAVFIHEIRRVYYNRRNAMFLTILWTILGIMLTITSVPALFAVYPPNWIHSISAVSCKHIM